MNSLNRRGPTFICVGPEKTGTTWLYQNFNSHPDLFLVPPKETRFFFENHHSPNETWATRLIFSEQWYKRHYRRYLASRPSYYLRHPHRLLEPWRLLWDWRYLFSRHDDSWYLSAFDVPRRYRVTGEISPQYFFMPEAAVSHVQRLTPEVKIILFLRNPLDWFWSFAKMKFIKNKGEKAENIDLREVDSFLDEAEQFYLFSNALKKWKNMFSGDQIFIGFFDDLFINPESVHAEICQFLGLSRARMPAEALARVTQRINVGVRAELPYGVAKRLAGIYADDVAELARLYPGHPQMWLRQIRDIAKTP